MSSLSVVLVSLLIAVVFIMNSIMIVRAARFAVVKRFGRRIGGRRGVLLEGFHWLLPIIETAEIVSMELAELKVNATFTTKDKLQVTVNGSLQYRPDPEVTDNQGRNVFVAVTEQVIKTGIEEAISGRLGGLGGKYDGMAFVENRQALGDIINALLKLKTAPHLTHPSDCSLAECGIKAARIPADKLIEYYNAHWEDVNKRFADLKKLKKGGGPPRQDNEHSDIEERYGIEIETFAIGNVDFGEQTKKDFEKEQQVVARAKTFTNKMELALRVHNELGGSAQVALNAADVSLDPAIKKTVVSVEGEAGVLGALVSKFSGDASKGGSGKKGKE